MPEALATRVRLFCNPWSHTVPNDKLVEIMTGIAERRAEHVAKQFEADVYKNNSLGLAFLDPTAPLWRPSNETLLATLAIGPDGQSLVVNAVAKAVEHRNKGQLAGYGVYVDLTQTEDGDFCWGFSTQVDNQIAGASGQEEIEDACEAGHAAVSLNYEIRTVRKAWLDSHRKTHDWFCNEDLPLLMYTSMAAVSPIYDSV